MAIAIGALSRIRHGNYTIAATAIITVTFSAITKTTAESVSIIRANIAIAIAVTATTTLIQIVGTVVATIVATVFASVVAVALMTGFAICSIPSTARSLSLSLDI
jgi:hypothetical protein